MDFPIYIDTFSIGHPIVYFKGSQVDFSKLWCISVLDGCFILANRVDPDGIIMLQFIWVFIVCQSLHLGVSSIQSVNCSSIALQMEHCFFLSITLNLKCEF